MSTRSRDIGHGFFHTSELIVHNCFAVSVVAFTAAVVAVSFFAVVELLPCSSSELFL